MKTTVLAFVLVTALAAGAQDATPQQTQPAAAPAGQSSAAAPEIKDPANITLILGRSNRRTLTPKSARWRLS